MTTCQVTCSAEDGGRGYLRMTLSSTWLSLSNLSRIYGISALNCEKTLQQHGWRDCHGHPTSQAIKVGASFLNGSKTPPHKTLWNEELCRQLFEKTGYKPISKTIQIELWVKLLEALQEGSPSIDTTAEQMAEEIPSELIEEVNDQLARKDVAFRVSAKLTA